MRLRSFSLCGLAESMAIVFRGSCFSEAGVAAVDVSVDRGRSELRRALDSRAPKKGERLAARLRM